MERYYAVVPSVSTQQYGPFNSMLTLELFVEWLVEWKHGKQSASAKDIVSLTKEWARVWRVYE